MRLTWPTTCTQPTSSPPMKSGPTPPCCSTRRTSTGTTFLPLGALAPCTSSPRPAPPSALSATMNCAAAPLW